jgi:NAD(P)-dependent dehydrogenase (short-subunit alcohol dehydrogenase family)
MGEFAGATAVVTGAGSGLGAAMADTFAAEDANVVLLDIDGGRAEANAATLRARGVDAIAARVDVADPESLEAAAALTRQRFGTCELLCANVGVQQFGAIDRLTDADWDWVLSVNVMGTVRTVRTFLPLLRAGHGERHVVITSSSSFFVPGVRLGAYVTSKYAVVGFGEVLRLELEPEGIGVTMLFPAGMETRHLESSALARPEALGESVMAPDDIEAMMASRGFESTVHTATADHAVRNLVTELRANVPYVITHGSYRGQVTQRQRDVLDALDRMEAS